MFAVVKYHRQEETTMYLNTSTKIRLIAKERGLSIPKLAEQLGCTKQNLFTKLRKNTWKEADLMIVADKLGCSLDICFIDKQTGERY